MPKISVIICSYNGEEYISEAIESVLSQTYQDFELLIVDDGSTDRTKKIVISYVDQFPDKVRYVYKEHTGLPSTRNKGIVESRGDYIAYLDHDDLFLPEKLQKQINVIENADVGLVHCARYTKNMFSDEEPVIRPKMPARNRIDFLEGRGHISMTILVAREILIKAGLFDENIFTCNDTDMWLRVAKDHEIAFIEEPLMTVRKHGSNMSTVMREQMGRERIVVAKKMLRDKGIHVSKKMWRKRILEESWLLWTTRLKKYCFIQALVNIKRRIQGIPVE